tara:strand:+ start:1588 stop:1929 length:342 start_codon:yes stop_codon:yes gene_type:complete
MVNLSSESCEACRMDASKVSISAINTLISEIKGWELITDPIDQLKKVYNFPDYKGAVDFSNKIAVMADREDHHPKITLEWGKVSVLWWSHKIKGLHKNDFICAAKTDNLYQEK